jgi:hypothetical protein
MSNFLATCRVCGLQAEINRQQLSPFTSTKTTHVSHVEMARLCRHPDRHDGSLSCVVLQRMIDGIEPDTTTFFGIDRVDLEKKQWDWQTSTPGGLILTKVYCDEPLPMVMTAAPKYALIEPKDRVSRRIEYYRRGG